MPSEAQRRKILCYVTDRRGLARIARASDLLPPIREAVAAGVDWIQIREKDLSARELLELARQAIAAAAGTTTKIVINDRLDVALAARAAGVHLGGESAPVEEVARWCRAGHARGGFLIGASCHSMEGAVSAERDGADYIFFGPIFATPSKLAFGRPIGVGHLSEVCRRVRIPVLAIGGVEAESAHECFLVGAAGIAAIRLFQQSSSDLSAVVARLREGS